jgi:hypothetical protein
VDRVNRENRYEIRECMRIYARAKKDGLHNDTARHRGTEGNT